MTDLLSQNDAHARIGSSNLNRRLAKAWRSGKIQTIQDLEIETYGFPVTGGARLAKDAAVTYNTTGFTNNIYGAKFFRGITTGYNALGAIGFKPWQTNGYRAITLAASTAHAGIALGAAIPATLKPTADNIDIAPTLSAIAFEMDSTSVKVNPKNDGASWEEYTAYMADEFKNRLNRALVKDADTTTTAGIDTIDRIIASYAEIAYGDANNSTLDANDLDVYGLDRDADPTTTYRNAHMSYVSGLAYGSGDRTFALSHIDEVIQNCRPYWENRMNANKFILTGDDTAMRISQLYAATERIQLPMKGVTFSVNGVKSVPGVDAGVEVAAYRGIPIIPDEFIVQDTISRFYMIDQDNFHIGTVTPPSYLFSDDYQALDKFANEGVWYMEGEIVCTKFPAQGKGRDFK